MNLSLNYTYLKRGRGLTIYKNGKDKSNMSGEIPQITYIKID